MDPTTARPPTPDVSIVLAARNENLHIREAVKSILSQKDLSFELIFVDDNSTDNTFGSVASISQNDARLVAHKNPKIGKCSAFNYGISLSRGRFVCIFAGDDVMPPGSLRERFLAVENEPDEVPVVGLSKLITMSEDPKFDGHLVPRAKGRGATSGVSPLMNRMAANFIFPTPEHLPNEDTWMELAVLHMPRWKIIHSDIICCKWRVHSGNSINHTVDFDTYNQKISIRMEALSLFMEKYGAILEDSQKLLLQAKIEIEQARKAGKWFRVLTTKAPLVDRLRALSITNSTMYSIRRHLYGLLSGW